MSIPLWSSNRCLGKLSFDYADKLIELRPTQREFLRLFGKQVAALLERAQLQERDAKKRAELKFFHNMMQDLTTLPLYTGRDVDLLLNRIRAHVGQLIDVSHFTIGIMDKETGLLDLRLRYENNQRFSRVWKKELAGFIWDVVAENKSLFLPSDEKFLPTKEAHPLLHSPSTCWMGVPLRVTGQVIGGIALQSKDQNKPFTHNDFCLLSKIAHQVAGIIQRALLAERDAKHAQQLSVLHQASEILMKLAEEKEELVWHAAHGCHSKLRFAL